MSGKNLQTLIKNKADEKKRKLNLVEDPPLYYAIVMTNLSTNAQKLLHVCRNYTSCVMKFHDSYKQYINDDNYLVREVSQLDVLIYKRDFGYLYNSKHPYCSFKLLSFYN